MKSDSAVRRCAASAVSAAALGYRRYAYARSRLRPTRRGDRPAVRVDGPVPPISPEHESLVQSVLAEAIRNVHKHAAARSVLVRVRRADGVLTLEVENDGVSTERHAGPPGLGLRLAALEALHAGGLLDFGERTPGQWQVRLAVPEEAG